MRRRSMFGAQPARALAQALRQQPRRSFATPPIKDTSPPSPIDSSNRQAHPIGPFYESILKSQPPIPDVKPEVPPTTASEAAKEEAAAATRTAQRGRSPKAKSVAPSSEALADSPPTLTSSPRRDDASNEGVQTRASVIFGSSLAGPAERADRLAVLREKTHMVAGVRVPPRPDEPDNCCMNGCVNCVWDRYRDEMEEWATAKAEADRRLQATGAGTGVRQTRIGGYDVDGQASASKDKDGGVVPSDWEPGTGLSPPHGKMKKDFWNDELYKDVPVGIREFMKTEKLLKAKHSREGTAGG